MNAEQARTLFLDQLGPRDDLARYGEKAAVAAILAVTEHLEAEARRFAEFYKPHSDGRNTFVIFADAIVGGLTAERLALNREQSA